MNSTHHTLPVFTLKPGKESLARGFHPWVFSGALEAQVGSCQVRVGQILPSIARLEDSKGRFMAWAQVNPTSKIRLRLCSPREENPPDLEWLKTSLTQALGWRQDLLASENRLHGPNNACRLVFSESDKLPGLVMDQLGNYVVVQLETAGADTWRPQLQALLPKLLQQHIPGLEGIVEQSDSDGRRLEGLPARQEPWWGALMPDRHTILEDGLEMQTQAGGQKTGFYTDQRANRRLIAPYARGRRVLDVCSYSGGFAVHAARAGAAGLVLVDSSQAALDLARSNLEALARSRPETATVVSAAGYLKGNAWEVLRQLRKEEQTFDLIITDPPKLAPTRQSLDKALRAYKDLNLQAMELLAPGGLLAAFSCSGLVSPEDLRQVLAFGGRDCGRQLQIVMWLFQNPDHPEALGFPESRYLKGFLLRDQGRN